MGYPRGATVLLPIRASRAIAGLLAGAEGEGALQAPARATEARTIAPYVPAAHARKGYPAPS